MKNIILKGVCAGLFFMSLSCNDYVDIVPNNIAEIDNAFETRESAMKYLATLYSYLPPDATTNNPALAAGDEIYVNDDVASKWPAKIIARGGQQVVTPQLGYWGNNGTVRNLFIALRDCNIFLENIDKPFNLKEDEKKRWIAEAKFLKAYYHFYLMRMYGPIPIVRENIPVSASVDMVRVSRDPVDEVVKYIVQLLDESMVDLPLVIEDKFLEKGRITAPIAAAIKARVLVTAASPLFNGNLDYSTFVGKDGKPLVNTILDENKWVVAAEACKAAIDLAEAAGNGLYKFEAPLPKWSAATVTEMDIRGSLTKRWNKEIVWGNSNSVVGTDLQSWAQAKIVPGLKAEYRESTQSWWSPPLHIAEMFYSENGVPIEEDVNYDYANRYQVEAADANHKYYVRTGFVTAKLNLRREPRFYASLGFDGGFWFGHGVTDDTKSLFVAGKKGETGGKLDGSRYSLTGYWAKKLVYYENVQSNSTMSYSTQNYPFPLVRLADLYLMYAEALNESSGPVASYEWVDKVRSRSGLKGVVESWAAASVKPGKPGNKDGMRDIIQQERMIELVFEGQRFWDLRRWKRASEFLNKEVKGWNIEGETTDTYYKVITYGNYRFLKRDYLWPISETDLINNANLIQNPGWN